jgi:hypothetical protein
MVLMCGWSGAGVTALYAQGVAGIIGQEALRTMELPA